MNLIHAFDLPSRRERGYDRAKIHRSYRLDTVTVIILVVAAFAAFTESVSGFGASLIAMAALPAVIGIKTATPLMALCSIVLQVVLVFYYRGALNPRAMWRVIAASLAGIPLGIYFLRAVDENIVLGLLGVVLVSYALYSLLKLHLPAFTNPHWGWLFGFIAGILGGAYNTSGPPVVIYGQSRRWGPAEFKANLQTFFLVNAVIVLAAHRVSGNITPEVWSYFLIALPALAVGMGAGLFTSRFIDPLRFRQIVQVLLIGLGLRLIFA